MQKTPQVKLLEAMSLEGVGCNFDVVPFINENFAYSYYIANCEKNSDRIDFFLKDLESRHLIESEDEEYGRTWIYETVDDDPKVIISLRGGGALYFKLKTNASDYLDTYRLTQLNEELIQSNLESNKATLELNKATKKNQTWQIILATFTVFISAFAIWLSYESYIKPEPKMTELNKNIQSVSKELEGIKTMLIQQKNYPIPPAKSSHKH